MRYRLGFVEAERGNRALTRLPVGPPRFLPANKAGRLVRLFLRPGIVQRFRIVVGFVGVFQLFKGG